MKFVICILENWNNFLFKDMGKGKYIMVHACPDEKLFDEFNKIEFNPIQEEINIKILKKDNAKQFLDNVKY